MRGIEIERFIKWLTLAAAACFVLAATSISYAASSASFWSRG